MRCENCKNSLKTEKTEENIREVVIRCNLTPRHRIAGRYYNSFLTYSHKIVYAPKWCPLKTKKDGASCEHNKSKD